MVTRVCINCKEDFRVDMDDLKMRGPFRCPECREQYKLEKHKEMGEDNG